VVDRDIQMFAAVMAVLIPSFAAVVATVVIGIRALRRRDDRRAVVAPADDERMRRLEQAVDAIALELERVGEGQRYLTQIMSQRLPASNSTNAVADVQRGRIITPH
jgi:hypothetical protein